MSKSNTPPPAAHLGSDAPENPDTAARQTHDVLVERASSAWDYQNMTRITQDMTLEEGVAKLMGVTLEEARKLLGDGERFHPR